MPPLLPCKAADRVLLAPQAGALALATTLSVQAGGGGVVVVPQLVRLRPTYPLLESLPS